MKIEGAIFDLDGTLVDSLGFWPYFWEEAGKKYLGRAGFVPSQEIDFKARTATVAEVSVLAHETYGFGKSPEEFLNYIEETVTDWYITKVQAKEGVMEFLKTLEKKGIKMCIASASNKDKVELCSKKLGIDKYIPKILSCNDIGKNKSEPDIYYAAAEYLGMDIEKICVFEDSYIALQTAKKAGFQTVGIYDVNNYGQDELKKAAQIYIENGETLNKIEIE